jgi:hypothetical protein
MELVVVDDVGVSVNSKHVEKQPLFVSFTTSVLGSRILSCQVIHAQTWFGVVNSP